MSTTKNIANQRDDHLLQEKGLIATVIAAPVNTTPVYTGVIDLGFALPNIKDARLADFALHAVAPVHATASLGDAATMTVDICAAATATPTAIIMGAVIVQTGAGGAGAAADEVKLKLPTDCARYIRAKVTASTTDAQATGNYELSLVF